MKKIIFVLVLSLLFIFNLAWAQNKTMIGLLGGGISKLSSDGSEYWNMGFNISGEFFQEFSENLLIGGRVAYNRWSPNEDKLKSDFAGNSGLDLSVSGSASIAELVPSVRFFPSSGKEQQKYFFGQIGAGLYLIKMDADVSGSYNGNYATVSIDDSDSKFGINVGVGIIIGGSENIKFTVYPMFNMIFTEEETTNYFTVNLGILFQN